MGSSVSHPKAHSSFGGRLPARRQPINGTFPVVPETPLPLPYEIVEQILSEPTIDKHTLANCCRVSKAFCLVGRDVLYHRIELKIRADLPLPLLAHSGGKFETILNSFREFGGLTRSLVLEARRDSAVGLAGLSWKDGQNASNQVVTQTGRLFPNVVHLTLRRFEEHDDIFSSFRHQQYCDNLQTLVVDGYNLGPGRELYATFRFLPKLTSLDISDLNVDHSPHPYSLQLELAAPKFQLRELTIDNVLFARGDLGRQQHLYDFLTYNSFASLHTLNLSFEVDNSGIIHPLHLSRFTSLRTLSLRFFYQRSHDYHPAKLFPLLADELKSSDGLEHLALDFPLFLHPVFTSSDPTPAFARLCEHFQDPYQVKVQLFGSFPSSLRSLNLAYPFIPASISPQLESSTWCPNLRSVTYKVLSGARMGSREDVKRLWDVLKGRGASLELRLRTRLETKREWDVVEDMGSAEEYFLE
ncbi:hypothetical protein MNV49_000546 [Pseudohyphozyma bogoriensis]|nr:hypothetical protein MNV49_000546 [Pseudohyphozyma bogoriensis]